MLSKEKTVISKLGCKKIISIKKEKSRIFFSILSLYSLDKGNSIGTFIPSVGFYIQPIYSEQHRMQEL
ncbi:MAG: hypothetical protein CVV44_21350 [Spirochaetae bacterium HGW-Spirochaetae-1]|nr:MAG: hypothetical protein CVV44_21350 [Spirochaetae bacterium HGW-Spirochaetae-1]